jgi:hypothetical protein
MASKEWIPFDEARGIELAHLDAIETSAVLSRIEQGLSDQRGLSVASRSEAEQARTIPLVLTCGACGSPTAGVLSGGSLATFLPDSYTEDAIRLCKTGWLSRFSSTMGASGDFTMPTMPILCPDCGASVPMDGSTLYVVWNSVPHGETVAIAVQRAS